MYYFEYHKKSEETLRNAYKKYGDLFEEGISDESLEARYYLLEYLTKEFNYSGLLESENGKPTPLIIGTTQYYWSLSHSESFIAYIVSDTPVGIDIADFKERNHALLDTHKVSEYELLGGINWLNFYKLWTAKESIIKVTSSCLDDMEDISLLEKSSDSDTLFGFHRKNYRIKTIIENTLILSFTYANR